MNSLSTGFLESDYLIPSLQEVIESTHRTARAILVYPSVQIKGSPRELLGFQFCLSISWPGSFMARIKITGSPKKRSRFLDNQQKTKLERRHLHFVLSPALCGEVQHEIVDV